MTSEALYTAIGGIRDELIEWAETYKFRKVSRIKRWGALAAGLVLLVGVGTIVRFLPLGASAGSGGTNARTYMAYAGPIFPLTTLEASDGITAAREINYDFSPYATARSSKSIVTDRYALTNTNAQAVTVTAVYPFAATLRSAPEFLPMISANGAEITAEMQIGSSLKAFTTPGGEEENTQNPNGSGITSWESYASALESGEYFLHAFNDLPVLDQPVTVYEISNPVCENWIGNPNLNFEAVIDYTQTTLLSFGMNGGRNDAESGEIMQHFRIPEEGEPEYGRSWYLLVLGADVKEYRLQGYASGACHKGEEIDASATVTRYTSTLKEMLRRLMTEYWSFIEEDCLLDMLDADILVDLAVETMADCGLFSENWVERFSVFALEDYFSQISTMERVIYLAFPLTIPAGETVEVSIVKHHKASVDYAGKLTDRDGYDMVTQLGSTLTYTTQYASLTSAELIEIMDQNFGFDPENGITRVSLDCTQPHYWMDIRKKANKTETE